MNTLLKSFVPVFLAVLAFSACNKEQNVPTTPEQINITVKAVPEALANPETKTYIDNINGKPTIIWGKGEYMTIGVLAGETTVFATSSEGYADSWDGETEAYFGFSLTPGETAETYKYMGMYPASAAIDYNANPAYNNNKNAAAFKVSLPSTQNATASSYDPSAYIMVAKPQDFDAVQNEWTASYRRATALNKITLTNIPEDIVSVEFTAPDEVYLAGRRYIDLTTGNSGELYGDTCTETIEVKASLSGDSKVVWFTSWGAEIPIGGTFKIVAKSTTKSYTRTLTVANKSLNFKEGFLNTLQVNMASADVADLVDFSGDYIIGAMPGNNWVLMTSTNTYDYYGKADTEVTTSPEKVSYNDFTNVDDYIWTVSKVEGGYAIKSVKTGKYVNLSVDDNKAHVSDSPVAFSLNIAADHNATVKSNVYTERVLQYNSGSPRFAFYKGTMKDIYMIPAVGTPSLTFSETSKSVSASTTSVAFDYIAVSLSATPSVSVTEDNGNAVVSTSVADNKVIVALNENSTTSDKTIKLKVTATGVNDVVLTITQFGAIAPAVAGDVLWSEDFSDVTVASGNSTVGNSTCNIANVYGHATVSYTYSDNGSNKTLVYGSNNAGGAAAPELLIGKKADASATKWGIFTADGIPTGGFGALTLTYIANGVLTFSTTTTGVSFGSVSSNGNEKTVVITNSNSADYFDISFENQTTSNVRIDDISLVAGAPVAGIEVTTSTATSTTSSAGTTATLNGTITLVNDAVIADVDEAGFYYKLTSAASYTKVTLASAPTTTSFSYDLTGLTTDAEYTYYAYAIYDGGSEVVGSEETFTPTQGAASRVFTYVFNSKSWGAVESVSTGTAPGITWTSGADGGQLTSGQGIQVTTTYSGANATSSASFTNVSKIVVTYCTNESKGAGTIKVKVGSGTEQSFSVTKPSSGGTTLKTAEFTFNPNETGAVKITAECTTNSVYIYSIAITATN